MASGTPPSKATQELPPKYSQIPPLSWSKYAGSRVLKLCRVGSGHISGIDTKQGAREGHPFSSARSSDEASPSTPLSHGNGQGQFILEDESDRMLSSPAGSSHENTNHNRTPPSRHVDARRSPTLIRSLSNPTPPYRQDSAYESVMGHQNEDSVVDMDVQARNIRARERVEIFRGRTLRTRRILNERRQEVQTLRDKLRDATAKLMREIDELIVRDKVENLQSLAPYFEATRTAQDELGPVEDAYDGLEIRLIGEEEELEQEEMHFYTHNNITLSQLPDSKLDAQLTPLVQPYQPEDVEFQNLDLENELVKQYLGKVNEANHLKEEIDDLENEQYSLTKELAFRTRYNLHLSEEKAAFMFEYPNIHKALVENVQRVEDDLYDLRDLCIAQGLFTASEHGYKPRNALVDEIYEALDYALDRYPLRTAADHAASDKPSTPNLKDKRDYVNKWMLEQLQDSPVETLRLRSFIIVEYEKAGKKLGGEEWPTLVLGWWDKDDADEEAQTESVLSTMDALRGGTNSKASEGSLEVDLGDGQRIELEIMGSETGSYKTQRGDHGVRMLGNEEPKQTQLDQGQLAVRNSMATCVKAVSI